MPEPVHFLDLPIEVICLIVSYVDLRCMCRLEQVCKKLQIIVHSTQFYGHIDVKESVISDADLKCVLLKANKPKVTSLSLHKCSVFTGRLFRTYSYLFSSLITLNLSGTAICDEIFTLLWTKSATTGCLKELQVMDCVHLTNHIANQVKCQHTKLEVLQLSYHLAPSTVLHLVNLTPRLKILDTDGIVLDVEDISKILSTVPGLTDLCCPSSLLTDRDLDQLVLVNLKVLMIQDCDVSVEGVTHLKSIYKDLKVYV